MTVRQNNLSLRGPTDAELTEILGEIEQSTMHQSRDGGSSLTGWSSPPEANFGGNSGNGWPSQSRHHPGFSDGNRGSGWYPQSDAQTGFSISGHGGSGWSQPQSTLASSSAGGRGGWSAQPTTSLSGSGGGWSDQRQSSTTQSWSRRGMEPPAQRSTPPAGYVSHQSYLELRDGFPSSLYGDRQQMHQESQGGQGASVSSGGGGGSGFSGGSGHNPRQSWSADGSRTAGSSGGIGQRPVSFTRRSEEETETNRKPSFDIVELAEEVLLESVIGQGYKF